MKIFFILIFFPIVSSSQNLLLNSSFEEENICSEYKVDCAPEAWIYTVPSFIYYFKDKNTAHTGDYFVAIIAGHSKKTYYRTFVRSRLLCGLQKGKTYRLSMFVKSRHYLLDSMGVYFSNKDFLFEKTPYYRISPSVFLRDAALRPVTKDTNWQKIEIEYKATGIETFITLGNFSKRDVTGSTGIEIENNFFVLFDDVSLTPSDPNERVCPDWKSRKKEIYDQDERHEFLDRLMKFYRNKPPLISKATTTITVKVDTLIIPDVLFATNSFVLNKKAIATLDSLTQKLQTMKMDSIIVEGHTDWTGDPASNKQLSWRRASSVAAFLEKYFSTRISSQGYGSDRPRADNRFLSGRQRNRRVEVFFYIRQ